jgi:hypothetical protein
MEQVELASLINERLLLPEYKHSILEKAYRESLAPSCIEPDQYLVRWDMPQKKERPRRDSTPKKKPQTVNSYPPGPGRALNPDDQFPPGYRRGWVSDCLIVPVTAVDLSADERNKGLSYWNNNTYVTPEQLNDKAAKWVYTKLAVRPYNQYPIAWLQAGKYVLCGKSRVEQLPPEYNQTHLPSCKRVDAYDHLSRPLAVMAIPTVHNVSGKASIILD